MRSHELKSHGRVIATVSTLALGAFASVLPTGGAIAETKVVGWAVVESNGTLRRSKNVTANFKHGPGHYEIVFNKRVLNCTYSVTPFTNPRLATLFQESPDKPRSVQILLGNPFDNFAAADGPFHLQVVCG